jgi:hypothetical protein
MRHDEWMVSKGKAVKLEPALLVGFCLIMEALRTMPTVIRAAGIPKVTGAYVSLCQPFASDSVDHSAADPATICR